MKTLTCLAFLLLTAATARGAGPDDILGTWRTEGDESKVEIFRCGEKLCGEIVWLRNPTYTDPADGPVGTPFVDRKNPDPALQSRPLIGLRIMEGFTAVGDHTWGKGTCYDPKSGNTYRGKIRLTSPERLELRGFIGIPLFGRTSVWLR